MTKHYDGIVSLGYDCASVHFINFWLARQKNPEIQYDYSTWEHTSNRPHGGSFLFDWLTTPIDGVLKLFKENFRGFFVRKNLEIVERDLDNYLCICDKFFGVKCYHYPGLDMHYKNTRGGRRYAERKLHKHCEHQRRKYNYLTNKMRNLLESDLRVLFVLSIVPNQHPRNMEYDMFFREFKEILENVNCSAELLVVIKKTEGFSINEEYGSLIHFSEVDDVWKQYANGQDGWKSWMAMFDKFMEEKNELR